MKVSSKLTQEIFKQQINVSQQWYVFPQQWYVFPQQCQVNGHQLVLPSVPKNKDTSSLARHSNCPAYDTRRFMNLPVHL
jgi:hypothetical protein